jgi:hypothetical protein
MAISTNDLIDKFGTQDRVDDTSTSAIASGAFSVAADVSTWTNDDDAPEAVFALKCQWATVTNVANKVVNLYAKPLNIQGANDPVDPSTNRKGTLIGKFTVYAASTGTDYWFNSDDICPLPNYQSSQDYEFYLENLTGQQISAGWELYITPKTVGPHA